MHTDHTCLLQNLVYSDRIQDAYLQHNQARNRLSIVNAVETEN